jgi:hypothetical protein
MEKIIRNSAKCLKCNDEIESTHRHDFKWCSCGTIFVDGGHSYFRRGGKFEYFEDTSKVISNTEDITWRGETWQSFPFELGEIEEESKGVVPKVELRISNVNRVIESYLQEYDTYVKNNGYVVEEIEENEN